jgi:outer membrane protein
MKNISGALNAVLVVAVAILFYLHFSDNKPAEEVVVEEVPVVEESVEVAKLESNIGYINIDSLQGEYKLHEELTNKLKAREKKYKKEMTAISSDFERKVMEFQKKAPTMTQFEGQMKQKELGEEEQRLYKMGEDFEIKLQNEQLKLNDELQSKIKNYIKEFNKDTKYDIIIGASSRIGNMVLYFNEGIDISTEVAKGLNEQYDIDNAPKEKK